METPVLPSPKPYPLCLPPVVGGSSTPVRAAVAVPASKAKEFLVKLRRSKRNIWDRSRPDVQQWIQQFMYMGFDETVRGESEREIQRERERERERETDRETESENERG